jgi:hypothetical protein
MGSHTYTHTHTQEEDELGEDTGMETELRAARGGEDEMEVEGEEDAKYRLSVHDLDAFWLQRQLGASVSVSCLKCVCVDCEPPRGTHTQCHTP